MSEIKNKIRDYVQNNFMLAGNRRALADHDSLLEHQIVDSTGFLELVAFIESEFGISVEDHELVPENLDSLERIANFVARKRAA